MAAEDSKNVGTITVKSLYFTIDSEPSYFTSGYRSDLYYHVDVTFYNYSDSNKTFCVSYVLRNPSDLTDFVEISTFLSINASDSTTHTFKIPTNEVTTDRTTRNISMYDSGCFTLYDYKSDSVTIKSPPNITTTTVNTTPPSTAKEGDSYSTTATVSSNSASSPTAAVRADVAMTLTDASATPSVVDGDVCAVILLSTSSFVCPSSGNMSVDFKSGYTLGTWTLTFDFMFGWGGDTVYDSSGNSLNHPSTHTTKTYSITVSKAKKIELGTSHTIPSSIKIGQSTSFQIEVNNTYTSDKTGYFKFTFGYPSPKPKTGYTNSTTVCASPILTFTKSTKKKYSVNVTIPSSYTQSGKHDVIVDLYLGTSCS